MARAPKATTTWRRFQGAARRSNYKRWSRQPSAMSRRGAARGKRMYRARRARMQFSLPKFMLAQIDPFSRDAMHVRVPDDSTAPSTSFYTYDEINIAPNNAIAGGAAAMYFYPNARLVGAVGTSSSTSAWTWPAAYGGTVANSKTSTIQSQFSVSRPVAHGIRLTCGLAPTSVTGYVHIGLYTLSMFQQSTWNLPVNLSQLSELPHYKRVTLASLTQNPLVVTNKWLDQTAFRYTDVSSFEVGNQSNGTFEIANSWMGIVLVVEGHGQAAGSTCLTVEAICHFEGQSNFGGLTQDRPAERPAPHVMDATAATVARTPASHDADDRSTMCAVEEANAYFQQEFMNAVGGNMRVAANELASVGGRSIGNYIASGAITAAVAASRGLGLPGVNAGSRNTIVGFNRYCV